MITQGTGTNTEHTNTTQSTPNMLPAVRAGAIPGWKRPGLHSTASLCPKILHLHTEGEKYQVRQLEANSTARHCHMQGFTGKCMQHAWTHTWNSHLVFKQGVSVSLLSWLPQKEQGLELWGEGSGGSSPGAVWYCPVLPPVPMKCQESFCLEMHVQSSR